MSDAAVVTCPRCGAHIDRRSNAPTAQCRYCGTVVELAPVPAPAPLPHIPPVGETESSGHTAVAVWLAVVTAFVFIVAGIAFWRAFTQPTGTVKSVGSAPPPVPAVPKGDVLKIVAPDLHGVDPMSVIQQSAVAVRRRGTDCELTYAAIGTLKAPLIDVTGSSVLIYWVCRSVDPSKAPGEGDVSEDQWDVTTDRGYLVLEKSGHGIRKQPAWVEPTCPLARAWSAAIASGVPANARITVYYEQWAFAPTPKKPTVWSLSVDGHEEYRREVDGTTCAVLPRH